MLSIRLWVAAIAVLACGPVGNAQIKQINGTNPSNVTVKTVSFDVVLKQALKLSSLTFSGKPFHAVMEIGSPEEAYTGRIEVWWANDKKYRVEIGSPAFHQTKVVNGDHVQLKTEGDYYPRWLENFVQALMDPVAMAANFSGQNVASFVHNSQALYSVASCGDRTNGITDPTSVGKIEFRGPDFLLLSTSMFNNSMHFGDWVDFAHKKVARAYETTLLDGQKLTGHLVVLEELRRPDPLIFRIDGAASADQDISTAFVPTAQAESLLESKPAMAWPPVREGRTDGYMIILARTDRTGQVRETSEFSSDNPNDALQKYGMEQALKYKFKPLVVGGGAVQLETPLVMHFVSRIDNPIPILSVDEMKKQIISCTITDFQKGLLTSGTVLHYLVSVDESGVYAGLSPLDDVRTTPSGPVSYLVTKCTFRPYVVNGQPTYYKGNLALVATYYNGIIVLMPQ